MDWGEQKSDKLSFSGEPDDDDTLDFQPMKTAFETSMGNITTNSKPRKGKTFGSRVKSSGGSKKDRPGGRFRIQRSLRQTFFGSHATSDVLEMESGMLADESSPEPSWRRDHALSVDQICDFGDLLEQKQPAAPHSPLAGEDSTAQAKRKPMTHSRSASTMAPPSLPVRARALHSRSTSSITALQPPPQLSASVASTRRSLHRSHSLALGTPIPNIIPSHPPQPWSMEGRGHWEENVNPNDLDAIEKSDWNYNSHKRVRGRRHSIMAVHPHSFSSSTATVARTLSNGSSLASSATHLPSDLNWLAPSHVSSPAVDFGHFESMGALSALSQGSNKSPTERSVASSSCRKRGVSGSPILSDDHDDWLTLSSSSISVDARRTRSRSRIFSPLPGETMPMVPSLAVRKLSDEPSSETKRRRAELDYGGRGDAMDLDDDDSDDDELSERKTTPDSSFESVNMHASKGEPKAIRAVDSQASKLQRILEHMPSVEDLNYLIHELQEQDLRQSRSTVFGLGDVWKVTPPSKIWTSQRRVAFTEWAKTHLGFTIRPVGMGFMYLQISKSRGAELLANLAAALVVYKQTESTTDSIVREESPQPLFCLYKSPPVKAATRRSGISRNRSSSPTISPAPLSGFSEDDADNLVDKVSSLSIASHVSITTRPLPRQVTVPPDHGKQHEHRVRLSVDGATIDNKPISSRPSFEGVAHSMNLNAHCFGDSPRVSLGRPPKASLGSSVCSIDTKVYKARGSIGRIMGTPCSDERTMYFVSTPLMLKDRGWGSRPIEGKDWGASEACDFSLISELVARFEHACGMEGSRDSFEACIRRELPHRKYDFDFDEEADTIGDILGPEQREASRKNRKRVNAISKRKRISLFVSATGAKTEIPKHGYSISIFEREPETASEELPSTLVATCKTAICNVFSFLSESELLTAVAPVCREWGDWTAFAHAQLLLTNVQMLETGHVDRTAGLERSWEFTHSRFPRASFLAEGGAKKVYKAFNSIVKMEEAVSVMDAYQFDNYQILANELAISAMLSSVVRRGICPNFLALRGVFTAAFPPPDSHWGSEDNKCPRGKMLDDSMPAKPSNPEPGRFQYIRTELINEGDAEELIKRQEDELLPPEIARSVLFQIAFGLYVAADKFSVKHYDVKLLNVFVQRIDTVGGLSLRYGLGSHVFALNMPPTHAFVAKIADFGTSNMSSDTNGLPVTIAHFTTLENTPFDFMLLGDDATQGHEHDSFGLGLCMLQLFTGSRPYEEILEKVLCPPNLKQRLKAIWENESVDGYSVIRSVIFDGVDFDEEGNVVEGVPDETFYHTLYRFLVLFGIPKTKFQDKTSPRVWKAISDTLESSNKLPRTQGAKPVRKKSASDVTQYCRDCKKYSIRTGNHPLISRARGALSFMEGGLELLLALCDFNPMTRATAMEVLNSTFMASLRERPDDSTADGVTTFSYMSFATQS